MDTESLPDLDNDDLWVRGRVYARHKRLLDEAEAHISDLERNVARARYEYEITQRIGSKVTDPQACQDWKVNESVAHDFVTMAEHKLAETLDSAAYYRTMVTEIENDLGDKAQEYLTILTALDWEDKECDEEYWDEFDEFEELDDEEFDPHAPIPF